MKAKKLNPQRYLLPGLIAACVVAAFIYHYVSPTVGAPKSDPEAIPQEAISVTGNYQCVPATDGGSCGPALYEGTEKQRALIFVTDTARSKAARLSDFEQITIRAVRARNTTVENRLGAQGVYEVYDLTPER